MSALKQKLLIVAVLLLGVLSVAAEAPERFGGRVIDAGGAVPGTTSARFTLHIDEYATAEEVQQLAGVLAEQGPDGLEKALFKLDRGWIRVGGSLGYPIAVARSIETEEGRIVRVVLDRPIQFFEVRRSLRSQDYAFGIIELKLDKDGKGNGTLIAAAKVQLTQEGAIEIESYGIRPFRLLNIKPEKIKKKKKKKD